MGGWVLRVLRGETVFVFLDRRQIRRLHERPRNDDIADAEPIESAPSSSHLIGMERPPPKTGGSYCSCRIAVIGASANLNTRTSLLKSLPRFPALLRSHRYAYYIEAEGTCRCRLAAVVRAKHETDLVTLLEEQGAC